MSDNVNQDIAKRILTELNAPLNEANLKFLNSWMAQEGTKAKYNPLSSTLTVPGSTNFNKNNGYPVQNYPDIETGAKAIARTISRGYPEIKTGLRTGDPSKIVFSKEFQKWSGTTDDSYSQAIAKRLGIQGSGSVVSTDPYKSKKEQKPASDSFFDQFGKLEPILKSFQALPQEKINGLGKFLLNAGKGKLINPFK